MQDYAPSRKFWEYDGKWVAEQAKMDPFNNPRAYPGWRRWIVPILRSNRPGVSELLQWAEREVEPIDRVRAGEAMGTCTLLWEPMHRQHLDELLAEIMNRTLVPEAVETIENTISGIEGPLTPLTRGLELWRLLASMHRAHTPAMHTALIEQVTHPQRCRTIAELTQRLGEFNRNISDLKQDGVELPESVLNVGLEHLVPEEIHKEFRTRDDLRAMPARMRHVRNRMADHYTAQSVQLATNRLHPPAPSPPSATRRSSSRSRLRVQAARPPPMRRTG